MIKFDKVTKKYGTGTAALSDISISIDQGEFVFIVGPSGSGKTTMLRLLIRDMLPTEGSILINNVDVGKLSSGKVPHLRKRIGVVFQDLKLLTDRTIFENIILPLEMANSDRKESVRRVEELMSQIDISEHRDKFPIQLSGGELQRVAIARALIFNPEILLADEPTGNLDTATSWEIVKLLQDINKTGTTVLMATHNLDVVNSLLKRIVTLEKGKLVRDEKKHVKDDSAKQNSENKEDKPEEDKPSDAKGHSAELSRSPMEDKKK